MNLISFTFEITEENEKDFIASVQALASFWKENGFTVSLYRDTSRTSQFSYTFFTEKSAEDLTRFIQEESRVRALFESIKENGSKLVVSVMEQVD